MKLLWLFIAGIAILVAAVFLWLRDFDMAFVVAVIGLVAWFLNYRSQVRAVTAAAELEQAGKTELEGSDEE